MELDTPRLKLILQTREEVEAMIAALSDADRAQVSPVWLAGMRAAVPGDPWAFAFTMALRDTRAPIGTCCFKGPPVDGAVEIAYSTNPDEQGKGYATEAARALVEYAAMSGRINVVRAHTLQEAPASQRVLQKAGFTYVGVVVDPEDGPVARFERNLA